MQSHNTTNSSYFGPLRKDHVILKVGRDNLWKGVPYYETGAVSDLSRKGSAIKAKCQGSNPESYDVWVLMEQRLSEVLIKTAFCSCPVGFAGRCKHVAAVLLTWADSPSSVADHDNSPLSPPTPQTPPIFAERRRRASASTDTRPKQRYSFGGLGHNIEQSEVRPTKRRRTTDGMDGETLESLGIRRWNGIGNTKSCKTESEDDINVVHKLNVQIEGLKDDLKRKTTEVQQLTTRNSELQSLVERQKMIIKNLRERLKDSSGISLSFEAEGVTPPCSFLESEYVRGKWNGDGDDEEEGSEAQEEEEEEVCSPAAATVKKEDDECEGLLNQLNNEQWNAANSEEEEEDEERFQQPTRVICGRSGGAGGCEDLFSSDLVRQYLLQSQKEEEEEEVTVTPTATMTTKKRKKWSCNGQHGDEEE